MTTQSLFKSPAAKQAVLDHYDSVLASWPVDYDTQIVNTRFGDTSIIASGDPVNPPMILLHGGSSNSITWAGDIADYAEKYRVYAVDLPGEPGKSVDFRIPFDGPGFAEWLDNVCMAIGVDKVTLVGLSEGGWVALKYAITYPERVSALVLLTPNGIVLHNEMFLLRMLPLFLLGKWGQKRALQLLFGDKPVPEGAVEGTALVMKSIKPRRETLPLFSDEELARLTMPVFLVGGEKDRLFDILALVERAKPLMPQLEVYVIPGAGHAIVHTAPDVIRFLASSLHLA